MLRVSAGQRCTTYWCQIEQPLLLFQANLGIQSVVLVNLALREQFLTSFALSQTVPHALVGADSPVMPAAMALVCCMRAACACVWGWGWGGGWGVCVGGRCVAVVAAHHSACYGES